MLKIKVSKEVANALEVALKVMDKGKFFEEHSNKFKWTLDAYLPLNKIPNWEMAQILINGYEVELSKEEKIKELYDKCVKKMNQFEINSSHYNFWLGQSLGIINCLEILEIEIKDIND